MHTNVLNKSHRKLIDIPAETFGVLNIKAASLGISLKKLIENILTREAEQMDDAELYRYLVKSRPEGKVMLTETEKTDFEQFLGLKNQ